MELDSEKAKLAEGPGWAPRAWGVLAGPLCGTEFICLTTSSCSKWQEA